MFLISSDREPNNNNNTKKKEKKKKLETDWFMFDVSAVIDLILSKVKQAWTVKKQQGKSDRPTAQQDTHQ